RRTSSGTCLIDKRKDRGSSLLGLLEMREMTTVGKHLYLRPRDQAPEFVGVLKWQYGVVSPPDYLHRAGDSMQPLAQMRIIHGRMPTNPSDRIAILELSIRVGRHSFYKSFSLVRGCHHASQNYVRGPDEEISTLDPLEVNADGADERQGSKPGAAAHRHLESNPRAQRMRYDIDFLGAKLIQILQIEVSKIVYRFQPGGGFRASEPGMIGHNDLSMLA